MLSFKFCLFKDLIDKTNPRYICCSHNLAYMTITIHTFIYGVNRNINEPKKNHKINFKKRNKVYTPKYTKKR